jgi:hypothetical protein
MTLSTDSIHCQCGCGGLAPLASYTLKSKGWVNGKPLRFIHGHNRYTKRLPPIIWDGYAICFAKCGQPFAVDLADLEEVNSSSWIYVDGYIKESKNGSSQSLHRKLLKPAKGFLVDHISGITLDNRRSNLRICTKTENIRNQKLRKDSTSGYKGVQPASSHGRRTGNWKVEITVDGKTIRLGTCADKIEAAKMYDKAARKYFGEFARTNFKEEA